VVVDVVVGSLHDPLESANAYPVPPRALVLTYGARPGRIDTAAGSATFAPAASPPRIVGSYGAGDSFAGALTWYLADGCSLKDACERAGAYGAAVLRGANPLEHQMPLRADVAT
jgi:ribokinase